MGDGDNDDGDDDIYMRFVFLHPDLGLGGAERLIVDAAVAMKEKLIVKKNSPFQRFTNASKSQKNTHNILTLTK